MHRMCIIRPRRSRSAAACNACCGSFRPYFLKYMPAATASFYNKPRASITANTVFMNTRLSCTAQCPQPELRFDYACIG